MCILVAEDDDLIRLILVDELLEAGLEVHHVPSGEAAVALLQQAAIPPVSLLVTDIHMPGTHDGLQLADHVQELRPFVPVIYTTGRPETLLHLSFLGPNRHLVRKPYAPSEILRRIRLLLSR